MKRILIMVAVFLTVAGMALAMEPEGGVAEVATEAAEQRSPEAAPGTEEKAAADPAPEVEREPVVVNSITWTETEDAVSQVILKFSFDITNNTAERAKVFIDFAALDWNEQKIDSFSYHCILEPEKTQTFEKTEMIPKETQMKTRTWVAERVNVYKAK